LTALDPSPFPSSARFQRALLPATHRTFDAFLCRFPVFPSAWRFARRHSFPPVWCRCDRSASGWRMLCQEKDDATALVLLQASYMTSRTGLEAEAISRLTDGLEPAAIRAILVQCLAGEVAPSTAISQMVAVAGASSVRGAIDGVTHRAATVSRASDRLVQDRVDELTQVFM